MRRQRKGFLTWIASLIPGAGELYMGFEKQGVSLMILFWGSVALIAMLGMGWPIFLLPVIWFYSFFHVHNLKTMNPEEFYMVEDRYLLHMDELAKEFRSDKKGFFQSYRSIITILIILIGATLLWDGISSLSNHCSRNLLFPLHKKRRRSVPTGEDDKKSGRGTEFCGERVYGRYFWSSHE